MKKKIVIQEDKINIINRKGVVFLITGKNGSGKSMLGKYITGLYDIKNINISYILYNFLKGYIECNYDPRKFFYFPQASSLYFMGHSIDVDAFLFSLWNNIEYEELLNQVYYLLGKNNKYRPVYTYSRGERTRIMIAYIKNLNPEKLYLDETDGFLDANGMELVIEMIRKRRQNNQVTFIVTHNPDIYKGLYDVKINLKGKESVERYDDLVFSDILKVKRKIYINDGLVLESGKLYLITGANGSGKTTFLEKIYKEIRKNNRKMDIGVVFYLPEWSSDYILPFEGISNYEHWKKMSWGERRINQIKLLMEKQPSIVILDEPEVGLWNKIEKQVINLIKKYVSSGGCAIIATNNKEKYKCLENVMGKIVHLKKIEEHKRARKQ